MGLLSLFSHRLIAASCAAVLVAATARGQTLATAAPVLYPTNIAVDAKGNLYIAETGRHLVRRVDSAGLLTTVAGVGSQGFGGDGGAAVDALFDSPMGLAVDASNLYIADSHNQRIRRVDLATGVVTTFAGGRTSGLPGDGGKAIDARLQLPTALALDSSGELYVADGGDHRIRRIDRSGTITTVAGSGIQGAGDAGSQAAQAAFDSPGGLAIDSTGNLFVADTHNHRICRIDAASGVLTIIAGKGVASFAGDGASAASAGLSLPRGLSLDDQGNLYIADTANHRIRRIDAASGQITTIAGDGVQGFRGDGGAPLAASLDSPTSVTGAGGTIRIADTANARVRQITSATLLQTIAGLGASAPGELTLAGASVVSYGGGQLVASLANASATGSITFLDLTSGGEIRTLASVPLQSGRAALDLSRLGAGVYRIAASYPGDQNQPSALSSIFALTVSPLVVSVTLAPSMMEYGADLPALQGALTGVLPGDQGKVVAALTSGVTAQSPAGIYPVAVALSGASASNYILGIAPTFTVARARTTSMLVLRATSISQGESAEFAVQVLGSTSATPAGEISVVDGGTAITRGTLDGQGQFSWSNSQLSTGFHRLVASYAGGTNFEGSISSPVILNVSSAPASGADFSMQISGTGTQTVSSGGSANFSFIVQPQNGLASQVQFAVAGLPGAATASFNPGYVPPGTAAVPVTLTIVTPKNAHLEITGQLVVAGLVLCIGLRNRRSLLGLSVILLLTLAGCGDRTAGQAAQKAASSSYPLTITGTATGSGGAVLQHSITFTLTVISN